MPAARIQPQGRVQLNKTHPLARDLLFAFNGANEQVFGAAVVSRGANWGAKRATPKGVGVRTSVQDTTSTISYSVPTTSTKEVTLLYVALEVPDSDSVWADPLSIGDGAGADIAFEVNGSTNPNRLYAFSNGSYGSGLNPGGVASARDGKIHASALTLSAAANVANLYLDAKNVGSSAYAIDSTFSRVSIGNRTAPANIRAYRCDGFLAAFVFKRALTAAEIASVSANPWQLFEGQPAMLSAAAAPSGSGATASPPGVSASSAVGSATIIGQAKAAPAGVAATAAAGTATASGSTVINGTASPAGVSAAASAGSATVSGQAKAAPSGISASAAVGTATATGQAITTAYPAGVQAVAVVGSATVRGTATAAPLGVSSAIYVGTAYAYGPFDLASYPKLYATTLMRLDTVNRQGGVLKDVIAAQSDMRATQACSSLMRAQAINITSAMRSDPINRTVNLL